MAQHVCPACDHPLTEEQAKECRVFGVDKGHDLPEADDLMGFLDIHATLTSCARALFHAIFCVWYYEKDAYADGMMHESVTPLTGLGMDLCEEIDRAGARIYKAGRLWEERAEAAAQEEPPPPHTTRKGG